MTGKLGAAGVNLIQDALRQCRTHFVYAAIFSGLLNLLYLAPTIYMLQVYDRVVPTRGVATLGFLTVALLLALGTFALLDSVRMKLLQRASVRLEKLAAGPLLFAVMGRLRDTPAARSQAMREFDTLRQVMTGPAIIALFDAPWTPIYIIVCFLLHPLLGAVALVASLMLTGLAWLNERATAEPVKRASTASAQAYFMQDFSIRSSEVVRSLGMRQALVARHMGERSTVVGLQGGVAELSGGYLAITKFLRLAFQSLALGVGAYLAIDQSISAGAIFAASLLISRALQPIEQVLSAWRNVLTARAAYRSLYTLVENADLGATRTALPAPSGRLSVERLGVFRPSRDGYIIQDISFEANPGEVIALIGPSGAGKSTLLRALSGGLPADSGAIRLDGASYADWDEQALARHIGYSPQDPTLFPGTIADNVGRFQGAVDRDRAALDARVVTAAQLAGAHEMILRLPQGYETLYGVGANGLSSGQAQRVALARALFDQPPLVLLDEPNAHLDADGEARLVETLRALKAAGCAVIVSAHRTGILAVADKVLVIRDGRIAAFGARDEVLRGLAAPPAAPPVRQQRRIDEEHELEKGEAE